MLQLYRLLVDPNPVLSTLFEDDDEDGDRDGPAVQLLGPACVVSDLRPADDPLPIAYPAAAPPNAPDQNPGLHDSPLEKYPGG
jgi:hypothetical protein